MLLIAALGVAFYTGIRASGPDMELSADALYDQTNLMDIRVLSTLGMTDDDVSAIRAIEGVSAAQGAYSADSLCVVDGKEYVATLFSLCDSINQPTVEQGRLPETASECFADTLLLQATGLSIGDTITLAPASDDLLARTQYTIVGSGTYSWYLNWRRGSSSVGDGTIDFFLGLHPDAFSSDVYTVVYASVDSADSLNSYSEQYEQAVALVTTRIEEIAGERCSIRYQSVVADAQADLDQAQTEIDDAQQEINDGKLELADALEQLNEADATLADNEQTLADAEQRIREGERELADGQRKLNEGRQALTDAQAELNEQSALLSAKKQELDDGQRLLDQQKASLESGQAELDAQKTALDDQQALLSQQQSDLIAQRDSLTAQQSELAARQSELLEQQTQLAASLDALNAQKETLSAQIDSLSQGIALYEQLDALYAQRSALAVQLADAESALAAQKTEREQLETKRTSLLPRQETLLQLRDELNARQAELDQQRAQLDSESDAISAEREAINRLSPASWTTVDGYQAMLQHLASLENTSERRVLERVQSAVQAAVPDGGSIDDALLQSVVPGEAASAINEARASLSDRETQLAQSLAQLDAGQTTLDQQLSDYQAQQAEFDADFLPIEQKISAAIAQEQTLAGQIAALTESLARIDASIAQLEAAVGDLGATYAELLAAQNEAADGLTQLDAALSTLNGNAAQLESALGQIADGLTQIDAGLTEIAAYQTQLDDGQRQIDDGYAQLTAAQTQLTQAADQLAAAQTVLDDGTKQLQDGSEQLATAQQLLADKQSELTQGEAELSSARRRLESGKAELETGRQELQDGKQTLADKRAEYDQAVLDYEEAVAEATPELEDARAQLEDGREELASLEMPEWYVLDRNSIQTFVEYGMDADRIRAIGTVFPVIFFLVAALVCLTGMTRMVEEERTQIGTFKALGYDRLAIAAKYFLYALLSSLVGSVLGILIGSSLLPKVIMGAYGILYSTLTICLTPIQWPLALSAIGIAVFCTVFAAMAACMRTLRETPANLMRPSSPPKGKRVFLEYITPLWRHMSFAQKAAARNLFRYKKRLFMTVFGIAGCTALLLVGFGLMDSINKIVDTQYKTVWTYEASLTVDEENISPLQAHLAEAEPGILNTLAVHQNATDAEANGRSTEAYLFVPETIDSIEDFIHLRSRLSGETYSLSDEGVIITEKLSLLLNLQPGDLITICRSETEKYEARILAVAENYLYHYIYMTPACYEAIFGEAPEFTQLCLTLDSISEDQLTAFSARMLELEGVKSVSLVSDLQSSVNDMMDAMNLVIWVLIVAAGMLAFIVLFNLNNISILERRRELATLRVLGFYDGELAAYLYRENAVLSLIGVAAGIGLGIILHRFVILTCELDIIMFGRVIQPFSYAISILLTLFFAALVNFGMFFSLKKIDMVESLKSVE